MAYNKAGLTQVLPALDHLPTLYYILTLHDQIVEDSFRSSVLSVGLFMLCGMCKFFKCVEHYKGRASFELLG